MTTWRLDPGLPRSVGFGPDGRRCRRSSLVVEDDVGQRHRLPSAPKEYAVDRPAGQAVQGQGEGDVSRLRHALDEEVGKGVKTLPGDLRGLAGFVSHQNSMSCRHVTLLPS